MFLEKGYADIDIRMSSPSYGSFIFFFFRFRLWDSWSMKKKQYWKTEVTFIFSDMWRKGKTYLNISVTELKTAHNLVDSIDKI